MSRSSSSPMEQGELEASPDLLHSPRILVDLEREPDPNADFLSVSSRLGDQMNMEPEEAGNISSPERHEDLEDVLIIQPPQLQTQSRKEKHRRRHKESNRKKGKDDRYDEDAAERHATRKSDRQTDKLDDKFSSKHMKREEEREMEEHRRKKSLQERERLERLEMERRRLERERERKYLEQQERAAKEELDRKQTQREELERRQAAREKERARQGKHYAEGDRHNERGGRNRREEDVKRLLPDVGKVRRQNRETGSGVVPVRRPRSRSRSPLVRSEFSETRERDHSREMPNRNMQRTSQRESMRDSRREAVRGTTKELQQDGSRDARKELSREAAMKDSRRDVERGSQTLSKWNEDRQLDTQATTSDEEAGNQSPVPQSKAPGRLLPEGPMAETASSPGSDRTDRSDASASPQQDVELDRLRRLPQEVESDKSDAESEASGKSKSSSSSSSSNSKHSGQKSPQQPAHNIRSKFDDTVNDERNNASPPSSRSTRSSSQSSRSDDNYDENDDDQASDSPVPSPISIEPVLPNYFPAYQGCRNVEEFHCLNRIEEGTYGVVYRARDLKSNEIVALKRLKMEKEKEGFPITSLREINTLLKSQHENIVTVREIVVGSNMDKIYIVMDYVEHDLKSLMEIMKEPFSIGEVKTLLRQLLRGVRHLHDNWIIHRDLKTSNLLLSHKGILKIGDFGLAREYGSPLKNYTPIVVTLWYRSPELLLGTKLYSCPIDMWSVGCIFAEFLTRKPLFPGKSEIDELNRIFKELGTPTEKIWPGVGDLPAMKKCTFTEYPYNQLRTRFGSLLSDKGFELLNKFLTYNPERRITAVDAVGHEYFHEMPKPTDPSMFPTWPPKSEQSRSRTHGNSPKPPSGGKAYAKLLGDDDEFGSGFHLAGPAGGVSSAGAGFALKF